MVKLRLREHESISDAVKRFRKLVEHAGIKKEMRSTRVLRKAKRPASSRPTAGRTPGAFFRAFPPERESTTQAITSHWLKTRTIKNPRFGRRGFLHRNRSLGCGFFCRFCDGDNRFFERLNEIDLLW